VYAIWQASPGSVRRENGSEMRTPDKRKNRESYFVAVSVGSQLNEAGMSNDQVSTAPASDRLSVTSEPIDL